ncbi:type II CRISPR-associated endonuclease Cas1 [Furfurilactobacillus milii]|uniref:type II CRISPR-associated endonuclease Cas1 n=1 Tax=Furfurilactobacillus milii TaxID=2888272 RepID=UPI001EED0604|nr:type II CRISPR-associated endonuclease Cas1 [Furfurilactobacillus milii]MCF6418454.1 type II CRISPR-associated endonuclease Cas1 [Furfurilactobacillus milii]
MGWRNVVITQHSKLSLSANNLVVQTNQNVYRIPIDDIDVLLISTTQAVITTAVIAALASTHAKIIFSGKDGQPVGEFWGTQARKRTADSITNQVNWGTDRCQRLWTNVVQAKITSQMQALDNTGIDTTPLVDELDQLEVGDITNREAVAAHKYFPLLFGNKFSRRQLDSTNAALNYGYAILLSLVDREIVSNGYLTCIGMHHRSDENPYNLGSDLMEPFRPIVDYWLSQQKFNELTPDVKFGLVQLLDLEIHFNGKTMLVRNALSEHVRNCVNYLTGDVEKVEIDVEVPNEVSSHAINGHV